jgi:hypothetical protein
VPRAAAKTFGVEEVPNFTSNPLGWLTLPLVHRSVVGVSLGCDVEIGTADQHVSNTLLEKSSLDEGSDIPPEDLPLQTRADKYFATVVLGDEELLLMTWDGPSSLHHVCE